MADWEEEARRRGGYERRDWSHGAADEEAARRRFRDERDFGSGPGRDDRGGRVDGDREAGALYGGNRYSIAGLGMGMSDYPYREDREPRRHGYGPDDRRGFLDRAGDEVASWFGDDDARRRRDRDEDHRGRGPRNYSRSDERILEDVNDRLTDDRHLDASDIEVSVVAGEVTLNGTVTERLAKRHAEDLAESVSGVKHVQNNLRVAGRGTEGSSGTIGSR